jgi:predicted nucleic acid-binding protein
VSRPTATIDTSVLVSLQSADLLGAVSVLFERLLVPSKVREELERGGERNDRARRAISEFAIFEDCNDYDPSLVRLLMDTRENMRLGRDQGEAEAVIQAASRPTTMVLADDLLARKWARSHARECHGTIWICHELRAKGYLVELRRYYIRLLRSGRRQPREVMNEHLLEFHEPPITEEEFRQYTPQP